MAFFRRFEGCGLQFADAAQYLQDAKITSTIAKNLLRVYLLSNKESVDTMADIVSNPFVTELDLKGLPQVLIKNLDKRVRLAVAGNKKYSANDCVLLAHDFTDAEKKQVICKLFVAKITPAEKRGLID